MKPKDYSNSVAERIYNGDFKDKRQGTLEMIHPLVMCLSVKNKESQLEYAKKAAERIISCCVASNPKVENDWRISSGTEDIEDSVIWMIKTISTNHPSELPLSQLNALVNEVVKVVCYFL